MLSRYKIRRGKDAQAHRPPEGVRHDIRKHTGHVLSPEPHMVERYLADPSDRQWDEFAGAYRRLLEARFALDAGPFDALATKARDRNVYLGCSCPTARNPRVDRCHTWVALQFMDTHYPVLDVMYPDV